MPKREDEIYITEKENKVEVCPHGHWKPICEICNKPKLKKDIFKNIIWLRK